MRKQTKIVAVASAAALLAIGASMTSFAATGWVEEDGQWYYYDNDGNRVEDEWKKSGNNYYWLDSEDGGAMATDKLVEDDGDTYYVDGSGVMVTNSWVKVVNEDQDDESDPAEYRYYYMQSNGKAYKNDKNSVSKKTIDGKKYAFDSEGKMLYGWVNEDNTLATGDEDWKTAVYYFGEWNDGSMKTGWQYINVYDGWDNEDEDGDYWFYFGSNGQKRHNDNQPEREADANETVRINGNRYAFTGSGEMYYKWLDVATPATGATTPSNWKYFNDPQSGARQTKGWFKVVPKAAFDSEMSSDGNDEAQWYYADGDGELYVNAIKKISGKYYAFDEYGALLTGLVHMDVDADGKINEIIAKQNDNRESDTVIDADYLDDLKDGNDDVKQEGTLYYFGGVDNGDSDGAMKTGNVSLNVDGTNYTFNFSTSGGVGFRGAGKTGESKDVYYKYGMKMAASTEDKYRAAVKTVDNDKNDVITFVSSSDIRKVGAQTAKNKDENIRYYDLTGKDWYLIGTNGKIKDKANGVKDGDDYYFFTDKDGTIIAYADDKDFSKTDKYAELEKQLEESKKAENK